jgi:hypothetical protein
MITEKIVAKQVGSAREVTIDDTEAVTAVVSVYSDFLGSVHQLHREPEFGVSKTRRQFEEIPEEALFNASIPLDDHFIMLDVFDDQQIEFGGGFDAPPSPIQPLELSSTDLELTNASKSVSKKRKRKEMNLIVDDEPCFTSDYMRSLLLDASKLVRKRESVMEKQEDFLKDQNLVQGLIAMTTKDRFEFLLHNPVVAPVSEEWRELYPQIIQGLGAINRIDNPTEPDKKKRRVSDDVENEPVIEAGGDGLWADFQDAELGGGVDVWDELRKPPSQTEPTLVFEDEMIDQAEKKPRKSNKSPIKGMEYKSYHMLRYYISKPKMFLLFQIFEGENGREGKHVTRSLR